MLKKISLKDNSTGEIYHFSFEKPSSIKNLLTLPLGKFHEVFKAIDGEMKELGSNDANGFSYIFYDPDSGIVRVTVKNETDEDIDLNINYLENMPGGGDGNDIFLTKK